MNATALAAGGPLQTVIVQLIAFVLLLYILYRFVRPVLARILDQRARSIEETFLKIEKDTADTYRELTGTKEKLAQVEREVRERQEKALKEAQQARDRVLAEASAQVQAALEKARREIQIERDKAVLELRDEATNLTLRAADRLVQSAMNDSLQEDLVRRYLSRLDGVKKA